MNTIEDAKLVLMYEQMNYDTTATIRLYSHVSGSRDIRVYLAAWQDPATGDRSTHQDRITSSSTRWAGGGNLSTSDWDTALADTTVLERSDIDQPYVWENNPANDNMIDYLNGKSNDLAMSLTDTTASSSAATFFHQPGGDASEDPDGPFLAVLEEVPAAGQPMALRNTQVPHVKHGSWH